MRIKRFNESDKYDLSFDGFKELMSEVTDELQCEFRFEEYNERTDPKLIDLHNKTELSHWYECLITLREPEFPITDDMPGLDYGYLDEREGGIPFTEDPQTFSHQDIRNWVEKSENENNTILRLKSSIDNQVEKNNEIRQILIGLAKLQIRFKSFDNFKECRIGFDSDNCNLSIYFEMI